MFTIQHNFTALRHLKTTFTKVVDLYEQMFYYKATADAVRLKKRMFSNLVRYGAASRKRMTKRNFAMNITHGKKVWISYRDELRVRQAQMVREEFYGGAYGCPGEYFRGAAARNCAAIERAACENCWSETYQSEEWIPDEERGE